MDPLEIFDNNVFPERNTRLAICDAWDALYVDILKINEAMLYVVHAYVMMYEYEMLT